MRCCAGARGGRAEFSWDNVKSDRDREYYLGHSVKASVGRWQKGASARQACFVSAGRHCSPRHANQQVSPVP